MLKLDLYELTQAKLDEAGEHCGDLCRYAAPCIIGTIVPADQRERLDAFDDSSILSLVKEGEVEFPDTAQRMDAIAMQRAFDCGNWDEVLQLAKPYL
jgi:hypothetical protein